MYIRINIILIKLLIYKGCDSMNTKQNKTSRITVNNYFKSKDKEKIKENVNIAFAYILNHKSL